MNRVLLFLLLLIYSTTSLGINVTLHFCCGEITSLSVNESFSENCICGVKKKKCCTDKTISFQLKEKQIKSHKINFEFKKVLLQETFNQFRFTSDASNKTNSLTNYHTYQPPNSNNRPIFLLNQVFII
jgi:hypothetical protein